MSHALETIRKKVHTANQNDLLSYCHTLLREISRLEDLVGVPNDEVVTLPKKPPLALDGKHRMPVWVLNTGIGRIKVLPVECWVAPGSCAWFIQDKAGWFLDSFSSANVIGCGDCIFPFSPTQGKYMRAAAKL